MVWWLRNLLERNTLVPGKVKAQGAGYSKTSYSEVAFLGPRE